MEVMYFYFYYAHRDTHTHTPLSVYLFLTEVTIVYSTSLKCLLWRWEAGSCIYGGEALPGTVSWELQSTCFSGFPSHFCWMVKLLDFMFYCLSADSYVFFYFCL